MKKFLFLLLTSILFIPIVFAKDTVEITKIELDTKSEKAVINSEPTFDGLEINCDVGFVDKGDFVKYKVTIKNTFDEDFSIANKTAFDDREKIKYEFSGEEILKANGTIDVYVTITYENEIDEDLFVDGKYNENNKVVIELLNGANETFNPETSTKGIMFVVFIVSIIMFFGSLLLLIKNKKVGKILVSITAINLLVAPIITKALTDIEITVNVAVEIRKEYRVVYKYDYNELVKASEIPADFDMDGCFPFYDVTFDEDHKYYECGREKVYEDPKRYTPGEKVVVPTIKTEVYDTSSSSVNGVWTDYCRWRSYDDDSGYYYLCENGIRVLEESVNYWIYRKSAITNYGFTFRDNDPAVMKFKWYDEEQNASHQQTYESQIVGKWNTEGEAYIWGVNEFTMPNHNVYIDYQPPIT